MTVSYKSRYFATIAYADVFDFPLTYKEVLYWMIGKPRVHTKGRDLYWTKKIGSENYIGLKGRQHIISQRIERKLVAKDKLERANRVSRWYAWIPSVLLVGVTGGLAMENAKSEDDIDLFFITTAHSIWITRLLVTLITQLQGVRRLPDSAIVADSICLNMFMAVSTLTLARKEQDLFSAHEVLQMIPLWQRGSVYRKFLTANRWAKLYLPTAWADKFHDSGSIVKYSRGSQFFSWLLRMFEPLARALQLWYMKKRRTTEVIERDVLRFHPRDARLWVKKKYALRLKKANVPLDRIFYRS